MKKKIFILMSALVLLPITAFASKDSSVYIGGTLAQSFKQFHYQTFVSGAMDATGDSLKMLSGPRYDLFVGYILGKLRIEGQYTIISSTTFREAKEDVTVKYKATAIYANLIYDFWDMRKALLTPFIGAGVGLASPDLTLNVNALKEEKRTNGFSYQFLAGVNIKLVDWLLVHAKYSFLAKPEVSHKLGDIKSIFNNGAQSAGVGIILLL